jgi:hypothetical protein
MRHGNLLSRNISLLKLASDVSEQSAERFITPPWHASLMTIEHHYPPRKSRMGPEDSRRRDLPISPITRHQRRARHERKHHHDCCGHPAKLGILLDSRPANLALEQNLAENRKCLYVLYLSIGEKLQETRAKKVHLYVMWGCPKFLGCHGCACTVEHEACCHERRRAIRSTHCDVKKSRMMR